MGATLRNSAAHFRFGLSRQIQGYARSQGTPWLYKSAPSVAAGGALSFCHRAHIICERRRVQHPVSVGNSGSLATASTRCSVRGSDDTAVVIRRVKSWGGIGMSVEKAKSQLVGIEAELGRLKARLTELEARAERLRVYIEVAHELELPGIEHFGANRLGSETKGEKMAAECVAIISAHGRPMKTRELVDELERRGFAIGGENKITNLSSSLSKAKSLLRIDRATGWMLVQWDDASHAGSDPRHGVAHDVDEDERHGESMAAPDASGTPDFLR